MNTQSVEKARERGHGAAEAAANHAESRVRGWIKRASIAVIDFAKFEREPWLLETARKHAERIGVDAPPDKRAWGHVVRNLRRDGMIEAAGYASAESSNGSPKVLWRTL